MKPVVVFVLVALAGITSGQVGRGSPEAMTPLKVLSLQAKTAHVQGIDTDGTRLMWNKPRAGSSLR